MSRLTRLGLIAGTLFATIAPDLQAATYNRVEIGSGGFVTGFVFSKAQQNLYFARSDTGGAVRWDNANNRWVSMLDFVGHADGGLYGVESIACDPSNANNVYLACGFNTGAINDPNQNAIFRSTNKGVTLTRITTPFGMGGNNDGRSNGERLAVDPNKGSILFMGTRIHGLWKSTDSGSTWSKVTSFPVATTSNNVGINCVEFQKSSGTTGNATPTIYVSVSQTGNSIYKSTNGGTSWTAVAGQPTAWMPHHIALDASNVLYATYGNTAGPNGISSGAVYKLSGSTWTNITPVATGGGGWDNFGYGGLGVSATTGTVYVTTMNRWNAGDRVYRTTNSGSSWTDLDTNDTHTAPNNAWVYWHGTNLNWGGGWIGDLRVDPFNSAHVLYGTGGGIWESTNGTASATTWTFKTKGQEMTGCWGQCSLVSPTSGSTRLFSALGDIDGFAHTTLDSSPAAGQYNPPKGSNTSVDACVIRPTQVTRTYHSGNRGAVSWDGGSVWYEFGSCPPQATANGPGVVQINADGTRLSWAPSGGPVYFSTNNGGSWAQASGSPVPSNTWDIYTGSWDKVNASKLYTYDPNTGKIYRSTDGGATMTNTATLTQWGKFPIRAELGNEGCLWLPVWDGMWKSTDSGSTWAKVAGITAAEQVGFGRSASGTGHPAVYTVAQISGVWGVYRSDNAGTSWTRVNDNAHQYGWGSTLTGDPTIYGRVYMGTGGGIVRIDP